MPTISTLTVDVVSRTSSFSKGLKIVTGGLATLAAGAAFAFKQFEDAEKVSNQTAAVLESTGHAANVTAQDVDNLSQSLMRKTGIDDEVIASGENLLLTFRNIANEAGRGNDIFNQATVAITDMSAAMGQDLKSSAIQLGKALNDPIAGMTALQRVGVQFSAEQKKQIAQFVKHNNLLGAQKVILAEVSKEFAGSAEAQKTASQTMATSLGNLAEVIGGLVAPAFTFLADILTQVVTWLQDRLPAAWASFTAGLQSAWEAVKPFADAIGGVLIPLFEAAWSQIKNKLLPALEKFKPIFIVIGAAVVLFASIMLAQFAIVIAIVSELIKWVGKIIDAFMAVVNWVKNNLAEPIVGAIQKIIEWIGNVVDKIKGPFVAAWGFVRDAAKAVFDALKAGFQKLIGWVESAINAVLSLADALGHVIAEWVRAGDLDLPNLPPLNPNKMPDVQGGRSPINVTVNGWVGNDQDIATKLDEALSKSGRLQGRLVHSH